MLLPHWRTLLVVKPLYVGPARSDIRVCAQASAGCQLFLSSIFVPMLRDEHYTRPAFLQCTEAVV